MKNFQLVIATLNLAGELEMCNAVVRYCSEQTFRLFQNGVFSDLLALVLHAQSSRNILIIHYPKK